MEKQNLKYVYITDWNDPISNLTMRAVGFFDKDSNNYIFIRNTYCPEDEGGDWVYAQILAIPKSCITKISILAIEALASFSSTEQC